MDDQNIDYGMISLVSLKDEYIDDVQRICSDVWRGNRSITETCPDLKVILSHDESVILSHDESVILSHDESVILSHKRPIGFLTYFDKSSVRHIGVFVIDTPHRRKGNGFRTIQLLERESKEIGVKVLKTIAISTKSKKFFRKCGFSIDSTDPGYSCMVKSLF